MSINCYFSHYPPFGMKWVEDRTYWWVFGSIIVYILYYFINNFILDILYLVNFSNIMKIIFKKDNSYVGIAERKHIHFLLI